MKFRNTVSRSIGSYLIPILLIPMPLLCILALLLCPAEAFSQNGQATESPLQADKAGALHLFDIHGVTTDPLRFKDHKATVFLFIEHDCPIANSYAPEIIRIRQSYVLQQIAFFVVYVDSDLTQKQAANHAAAYGYSFAPLLDPNHKLSLRLGATVSPEAVVIDSDGHIVYRGRIDDRYVAFGKMRHKPTSYDLRVTLDAILHHQPVPKATTQAIGCLIPSDGAIKSDGARPHS